MTSSAAMASGVSTTVAGAGATGALAGDASGLSGLFSMLMGGASAGAAPTPVGMETAIDAMGPAAGTGMISVMLGSKPVMAAVDANGVPLTALEDDATTGADATAQVQEELQLGDAPAVVVSGSAEDVAAFIQQVKAIYQQVVDSGGLTVGQMSDSKELAGALTKLGMSPDEAMGVAERIQTMLKLLKDAQDADGTAPVADAGTQGTLAAMMLAIMGQQPAPVVPAAGADGHTLSLQITSAVDDGAKAVTISPLATPTSAAMRAWKNASAGDVTRQLLGLGEVDAKADVKAGEVAKAAADAATASPAPLQVTVGKDDAASIQVGLPEVKPQPVVAPQVDAVMSDTAQAATAVTTTGAAMKVAAEEQLQAPKGETYYKLQADKHGVETLEAVKPAVESRDLMQAAPQGAQVPVAQAAAAAAATAAAGTGMAERVAQIQDMVDKAQVGQQVVVQMQPLLAQGGGTVRMNLHPKDLGQITIELNVTDGKVHGSIAASEPAVVEQLARELHSLRHGLADAGLKLGDQGINLMLSGGNQNGQGQGQNPGGQQAQTGSGFGQNGSDNGSNGAKGTIGTDATTGLVTGLAAWVSPERVLDVNV